MVSRTCKTFHGRRWVRGWAVDRGRFDEMNDVKFNAANLSRCTHRRILNAHVALNGGFRHASASELRRARTDHPLQREGEGGEGGYPASHSETSETRTDDGIKHVGVQTRRYHLRGAFDALHNIWTAA